MPKTRVDFWQDKFATNIARDRRNEHALRADGWQVVIIWECETKTPEKLATELMKLLAARDRKIAEPSRSTAKADISTSINGG